MFEISKEITAYFEAEDLFTAICENRIYAAIAPEDVIFPFTTFLINQQETATKDMDVFDVTVFVWFDPTEYTKAIQFTDTVTSLVKSNDNWDWENSTFQYIEDNDSYCGIINFKIN
jgi:hypothetical protein